MPFSTPSAVRFSAQAECCGETGAQENSTAQNGLVNSESRRHKGQKPVNEERAEIGQSEKDSDF